MAISGAALSTRIVDRPIVMLRGSLLFSGTCCFHLIEIYQPATQEVEMRRFKIKKMTRATLAGVLIAVGSLYALSKSYDIPASTLLSYLFGSVILILVIMLMSVAVVFIIRLLARILKKFTGNTD